MGGCPIFSQYIVECFYGYCIVFWQRYFVCENDDMGHFLLYCLPNIELHTACTQICLPFYKRIYDHIFYGAAIVYVTVCIKN
jgi:hypothetical protein